MIVLGIGLIVSLSTAGLSSGEISCHSFGACGCKLSNGKGQVDLSPLMKFGKKPLYEGIRDKTAQSVHYDFDPCRSFPCGNKNSKVCAQLKLNTLPIGVDLSCQCHETGIIEFIYKKNLNKTAYFSTTVTLNCDSSQDGKGTLNMFQRQPPNSGQFYTSLNSKYACLVKSKGKSLSTGSILCIILLVVVVLYIVGGVVINKYVRKVEGDTFPNKTFWMDLPSLMKDGCEFAVNKLKSCRKSSEYQEI